MSDAATRELWVERVLVCCEQVPPGRVAAYGDIGRIVGRGPRYVGNVMGRHGSGVPWWRIVNASGDLPAFHRPEAFRRWAEEGIEVKSNGLGCRIAAYRADLTELGVAYERAMARVLADVGLALPLLSTPARRALEGAGITALEEVAAWRRADLGDLHGVGQTALSALDDALEVAGLHFTL